MKLGEYCLGCDDFFDGIHLQKDLRPDKKDLYLGPEECHVCHMLVKVCMGSLETHGASWDPCPGSRFGVWANREMLENHDDNETP